MNDRTTSFGVVAIHDITGLASTLTGAIATQGGRLMAVGADSTGELSKEDITTELSAAASEIFRELSAAHRDLRFMRKAQPETELDSLSLGVALDDARVIAAGLLRASNESAGLVFRSEALELLRTQASALVTRCHVARVLSKLADMGCRLHWPKAN